MGNVNVMAQNLKFGKPSQADWDFTAWKQTPDAEAVVLCKTMKAEYRLAGDANMYSASSPNLSMRSQMMASSGSLSISPDNTTMTYDVKMRLKILKDSGAGYANVDIVYFDDKNEKNSHDEFYSLKVVTFDNVNGKVKRTVVPNTAFKDERIDDHYRVRHIVVPGVKAGTIVEYQYQLFSPRYAFLYDWQLEEMIPVVYTKCEMNIPAFLNYDMQIPTDGLVKKSVMASSVMLENVNIDLQAPKQCHSNSYVIESSNTLPYVAAQRGLPEDFAKVHAKLKNSSDVSIEQLPKGKRHIMFNP